jgi:predicted nucleic acid-binding protein
MFANDTNILIYAIDISNPEKHDIARKVMRAHTQLRHPIALQSLQEFYFATTRKSLLSKQQAATIVRDASDAAPILSAESPDLLQAMRLNEEQSIPVFDALLLCTVARAGCTLLFSEDFQNGRAYGSITVRNPFTMPDGELAALLT